MWRGYYKMDSKKVYCSECMERCSSKIIPKGFIEPIIRIWLALLSFKNQKVYSHCCNSEVIFLNIKERIIMELENEKM